MGFDDLLCRLPLNRKERYYAATVFPAIVCADNFANFHLFLKLINCGDVKFDVNVETTNILFFTEYGLFESAHPLVDFREIFPNGVGTRDTPDILIFIDGPEESLLIAVEAKMYASFRMRVLVDQMHRQESEVLTPLRTRLHPLRVVHVALLPEPRAQEFLDLATGLGEASNRPVITWQNIYDTFRNVSSATYFLEILRIAMSRHQNLTAKKIYGKNMESSLFGEEILTRAINNGLSPYQTMGRQGGLKPGGRLEKDIASGDWKKIKYQVNTAPIPPNPQNWFLISEFIKRIIDKHPEYR